MLEMRMMADDGIDIVRRSRVVKYLFADDIRVECFCVGWTILASIWTQVRAARARAVFTD